ncbi:hypothetical protein [Spirochaeta lutea]|uniref:Uncharacterized protein n=1 Tax=Spirochaeta lutea TaxID=1480694 RepID=A0A098QZB8_9SPIO|nr:hypothetical protein [Spirochaeta lutea]KGE72851.1 hypothetical protein DC28_05650 [Spirochaeta lutea]
MRDNYIHTGGGNQHSLGPAVRPGSTTRQYDPAIRPGNTTRQYDPAIRPGSTTREYDPVVLWSAFKPARDGIS